MRRGPIFQPAAARHRKDFRHVSVPAQVATDDGLHVQLSSNKIKDLWKKQLKSDYHKTITRLKVISNTQKVYTTLGTNTYDKTVTTRKCTVPNDNLKRNYGILQTKYPPFTKRKSVVLKTDLEKIESPKKQQLLSG